MTALPLETLEERIAQSELGREWLDDPLMQQDIWPLDALGYSEEVRLINGNQNLYFNRISLSWLKLLTKLTIRARVRERHSLGSLLSEIVCLSSLNTFLVDRGYSQPIGITDNLLKIFVAESNTGKRNTTLVFAIRLWAEEGWLALPFTPLRIKKTTPKVETIPEEVLHQVYENLELFSTPLERLFRLQLALGCRISEMLTFPRHCLKREGDKWFLLRWIAKRKHWRYYQIHPLLAELVQEQQRFLDAQFGADSAFDKLFCKLSTAIRKEASPGGKPKAEPVYEASHLTIAIINYWLLDFRKTADLRDKHGNQFNLTSHMFRRTKASVMAYCEVEDEYIAAVLGHGSLDMLPHYRKRSLERLEKESQAKGYVDMYGKITTRKPRKQRYEKLADLLKVSTPLGECHRPTMLGDCQMRYACLSCQHHRVIETDRSQLETDINQLKKDLGKAEAAEQMRRVTEIERLLELLNNRLQGLDKLQTWVNEFNYEPA